MSRLLQHVGFSKETEQMILLGISAVTAVALSLSAWRSYEPLASRPAVLKTLDAGELDPVIGRDDEIDRVICILCRRTKNCAALVGAAGVGKTAIVEGLAQRIAAGTVPDALAGARVAELDVGAMVAGTRWRGMFEQRLKDAIKQAEDSAGKLILFIDEMHMIVGAGDRHGTGDAANILKPALARGRIRCIGATTSQEYRKHIEKDAALERRFQKVDVDEPTVESTIAILEGLKKRYESHHGLIIDYDALVAAARLAGRYITGRQFPDKAIDLIDEACTTAKLRKQKEVQNVQGSTLNSPEEVIIGPGHVAEVVSRWTKIPLNTLDQEEEKLTGFADKLHERVVGQDEAVNLVNLVAQEVLRSRVGFGQSDQPIASFLFLDPAGVGKTELAKTLAEKLFDNEKTLVRFDMSEYAESGSLSRLIGGPRSNEEGQLTEKVRSQPYSVVLFDEVDKANPLIIKVFIQLLAEGMLTDGKGHNVDFKNTIIIMTSYLGAENLSTRMDGENMQTPRDLVMKKVEKCLKPELINRLSEIVIFEPLSHDELRETVRIHMKSVIATVADKGVSLFASDAALDIIWSKSHDTVYGARPIKRWMKKNVTTVLADMMVNGEARKGSSIFIDAADDKRGLKYQVTKKQELADPLVQQ